MKVFLTGATGFIGGAVARLLHERGDDVVALVRAPAKAESLSALGVRLVQGDLGDDYVMRAAMEGCDAVIHCAAVYAVGVPPGERPAMLAANVTGTERVLGAALALGIDKVVYVSTVAAFGNTRGAVVDESHEHRGGYTSYYEETKHQAHLVARRLVDEGLPCVIVQPGGVYGPHDPSQLGNALDQLLKGRLPFIAMGGTGLTLVHRDDVAEGIVLALDKGTPGECYVLGGEVATVREFLATAARVAGRRAPRGEVPTLLVKALAPLGPVLGPVLGLPPNLGELVASSDGVTWWASSEKAQRELGYTFRGLEQGLRDTLVAEGRL